MPLGLLNCCLPSRAGAVAPDTTFVESGRRGLHEYDDEVEDTAYNSKDEQGLKKHHGGRSARLYPTSREPTFAMGQNGAPMLGGPPTGRTRSSRRSSYDGDHRPSAGSAASVSRGLFGMDWGWLAKAKLARSPTTKSDHGDGGPDKLARASRRHSSNTAELLQRRGFVVHLAKDIHKSVSTATTKPIAVLGMEPATDSGGGEVALRNGSDRYTPQDLVKRNHNKLFPLYINGVAKSYFKVSHSRDYAQVLRRLLRRDPLLTFALQKAIKNLSLGDNKPVSHVTSDPTGATASLYGLRITPCVWADSNGHKVPALLMEHNVAYDPQDVMPRLLRDYAVLSHVPSILTLIDFSGHVLYQNAASIDYCGDLTSHNVDSGDGMLGVLFQFEPQMLQEMLQEVNEGNYWQQVVRVPASLKRHMVFESDYASTGQGSRGTRDKKLTAAVSKRFIQDALEPEFQLESFTTQNARSKRNNPGGGSVKAPAFQQQPSMLQRVESSMARAQGGANGVPRAESGSIVVGGLSAIPAGRQASMTAMNTLRIGSQSLPQNTHVAFNLPHTANADKEGTTVHTGGAVQASFSTAHSKGGSTGTQGTGQQNRRFMTLMQSAQANQQAQQQSFTASMGSFNTDGEKPDSRQAPVQEECWHDVSAIPLLDPVLDKQVILLLQTNVTARVELENRLADLTDAQLGMLEQLFPRHVIEYMLSHKHGYNSRNLTHLANHHDDVIVLFTDVVGFTNMSKEVEPSEVMHFLNELYTIFDDLVDMHDLYKLDTVGDCYIVVAGLTMQDEDGFTCTVAGDHDSRAQNAQVMMDLARAMLRDSKRVLMPHNHESVQIRIGIHIGSLASGLVGPKMPKFTLFGDTMNTASRMESTCKPGCIQVSSALSALLPGEAWQDTGGVEVKGKGLMQTYLWQPKPEEVAFQDDDGDSLDDPLEVQQRVTAGQSASSSRGGEPGSAGKAYPPRAKSMRATTARPYTSRIRPKTSRPQPEQRVLAAAVGDDDGPSASPAQRSSGGGIGRSLSRRTMSIRHRAAAIAADEDDGDGGGGGMAPLMTILNAIRGDESEDERHSHHSDEELIANVRKKQSLTQAQPTLPPSLQAMTASMQQRQQQQQAMVQAPQQHHAPTHHEVMAVGALDGMHDELAVSRKMSQHHTSQGGNPTLQQQTSSVGVGVAPAVRMSQNGASRKEPKTVRLALATVDGADDNLEQLRL